MKTFTKQEVIQEMIDQLMDLADGFEVPCYYRGDCEGGVCWVVQYWAYELLWGTRGAQSAVKFYIETLKDNWPHHFGNERYPIAGKDEYYLYREDFPDFAYLWTGEHEVDRRDLCEWIADGLKELL